MDTDLSKLLISNFRNVVGYTINLDRIQTLYMYSDSKIDYDNLKNNYLVLSEYEDQIWIHQGSIYKYKDNDRGYIGDLDYQLKETSVSLYQIDHFCNTVLNINEWLIWTYEFDNEDECFINDENKVYFQHQKKYVEFIDHDHTYFPLAVKKDIVKYLAMSADANLRQLTT